MSMTARELWTVIHGLILGSIYLLAFSGGFVELWSFLFKEKKEEKEYRLRRLIRGAWVMAVTCWITVVTGTYVVYPWYRAQLPDSPRSKLLADPVKAAWHTFGMEWKEHVAWASPILATTVAILVSYYGLKITEKKEWLRVLLIFYVLAFVSAAVAGIFGAFINKVAPII